MTLENLMGIKAELKRFDKKLNEVINRLRKDEAAIYGCKETGAIKRAALDLKSELTKITK